MRNDSFVKLKLIHSENKITESKNLVEDAQLDFELSVAGGRLKLRALFIAFDNFCLSFFNWLMLNGVLNVLKNSLGNIDRFLGTES